MMVTVKGKRNDDGVTGTAEKIEVENEVRGTVTSVGTGRSACSARRSS